MRAKTLPFLLALSMLGACSLAKKVEGVREKHRVFRSSWSKNLDPHYETGNLPIASGGPLLADGVVYMGDLSGTMHAFSIENGREKWKAQENYSLGAKPLPYKNQIIYGSMSGRLISRHAITGELKYMSDLGAPIESPSMIYRDRVFVHLRNHQIVSVDAETGKILWAYKRSIPFTTTLQRTSTPLAIDQKLIVGFADGFVVALSVDDGQVLWERKIATGTKFVDVDASPLLVEGQIFIGASLGPLHILIPGSGAIIKTVDLTVARTPYLYRKALVVGTVDGELAMVSTSGEILLRKKIDDGGITSMAEWKNGLVVGTTSGRVYFVNPDTLSIEDRFDLGSYASAVFSDVQVGDGRLVVYSSRNRLYVFE